MHRIPILLGLLALAFQSVHAAEFTVQRDIPYHSDREQSKYARERCKLDLYLPKNTTRTGRSRPRCRRVLPARGLPC